MLPGGPENSKTKLSHGQTKTLQKNYAHPSVQVGWVLALDLGGQTTNRWSPRIGYSASG